jgi:hypothetical protein
MFVARADRPWFLIALLIVAGLAATISRRAPTPTPTYGSNFALVMQRRVGLQMELAQLRLLEQHVQREQAGLEDVREQIRRNDRGLGCILGRKVPLTTTRPAQLPVRR